MFTLGFDVAKDKLDVALVNRSGQLKDRFLVSNTSKDLSKLIKDVRIKHPKLVAGCEATGSYHFTLIKVCLELGVVLRILNPLMTKQYTRATIRGRKTDLDDALSIARLILRGEGRLAGISRSGITLVGGLVRGLNHEDALRFAFLLATPVIFAAGVFELPALVGHETAHMHGQIIVGMIVAGLTAYASIRFLTRYFQTRTLTRFAIYCLIVGSLCIIRFA